jgi:hypothetical protein
MSVKSGEFEGSGKVHLTEVSWLDNENGTDSRV